MGARQFGLNLLSVQESVIDGNFIGDVTKRVFTTTEILDKEACVAYCSFVEPNVCRNVKMINNIAAGCPYAGFVAPGHDCDDTTSEKFKDNVAHSSHRVGAHIYPDNAESRHKTCYEGSRFSAYKVRENGVGTHYVTAEVRMRDLVLVDQ